MDNEQQDKKVEFNDLFYREVLNMFLSFLSENHDIDLTKLPSCDYEKSLDFNRSLEYSRSLILQLILKCAQEHAFRFRIYAVQGDMIEKICSLTRFRSKLLNMWVIKLLKGIIKGKDDAFTMYFIKKNVMKTVIDMFLENTNKSNLLHSCILEMFDYLAKESNKKLGAHLVQ